jgi:hypothetical protein
LIDNLSNKIESRILELKKSLENLQNNANAHIGAIQELERLKKELEDGLPTSAEAGLDTANVSGNPA